MGLDISYASKINFDKKLSNISSNDGLTLFVNDTFLIQSDGIESGTYICEGVQDYFRAGSYSGYSAWRRTLSKMIGWELNDLFDSVEKLAKRNQNINDVLNESDELNINIPFVELIYFSDCEGFIGPKTCAKLYSDFLEWNERAESFDDVFFYSLYGDWMKAFEVASDGGCVMFH